MPEWVIWAVAIWFVFGVMGGRGCSWRGRRLHRARSASRGGSLGPARSASLERPRPRSSQRVPAPPEETAEERIRRRFVEGRTTLDEYEAELWEELRPKGSGS